MANSIGEVFRMIGNWLLSKFPTDLTEIMLFSISIGLIIIIASLIHYTQINYRIQNESRCYRDRVESNLSYGVYKVSAYNPEGVQLYEITYDIGAKQYTIEQKCPKGTVQNKTNIRVYDLSRKQIDRVDRIFECDKNYDLKNITIYYKGDPGLVRFMEYSNTDFFDRALGSYTASITNSFGGGN